MAVGQTKTGGWARRLQNRSSLVSDSLNAPGWLQRQSVLWQAAGMVMPPPQQTCRLVITTKLLVIM